MTRSRGDEGNRKHRKHRLVYNGMDDGVNDVEDRWEGRCGCVEGSQVVVVRTGLDEKRDLVISKGKEDERKLSSAGMQS